jgi:hypothetical protein
MVAMSEETRRRWEAERERREVAELEELARSLMALFGGYPASVGAPRRAVWAM